VKTIKYKFCPDGELFIGFLNDHPDYETHGSLTKALLEDL
jgi:hypothetical protein